MTLAIELPEELEKELLQQANINEFVQEAIKRLLLEQKQATQQNIIQLTQEQQQNFIDSLLNPKPANDTLKKSVVSYKERMGL